MSNVHAPWQFPDFISSCHIDIISCHLLSTYLHMHILCSADLFSKFEDAKEKLLIQYELQSKDISFSISL